MQNKEFNTTVSECFDDKVNYLAVITDYNDDFFMFTLVRATSEKEAINEITKSKYIKEIFDDLNEELKSIDENTFTDIVSWFEDSYNLVLVKSSDLAEGKFLLCNTKGEHEKIVK